MFNWTITLGNAIEIIAMLAAVLGAYTKLVTRITALETKVDKMWEAWEPPGAGIFVGRPHGR